MGKAAAAPDRPGGGLRFFHRKAPHRRPRFSRTAPPRAAQSRGGSAKKSGVSAVSGFIGVLFVIILLYSLASVLPLVAATGLVAGGILYWVQNYAFLLIVLAVLFFAFRRAGRKG